MIKFKESKYIYLYSELIDMRMGFNKIQTLVAFSFSKIQIRHSVFMFCSKSRKIIKLYYEDDYGAWLLQNKLFDGPFKWPNGLEVGTRISKEQLEGLCMGLETVTSKKNFNNKNLNRL